MKEFDRLVEIIKRLRGEEGCPWDREQTLETLKPCLMEETCEVLEAMDEGGEELKGELGDLLMNVVFQADICEDEGKFSIEDVARGINEKMIRRHPHVFKEKDNSLTSDEVLVNWEEIKKTEKIHEKRESALDGVPIYLPPLAKAEKIQKKAAKVGFDWDNIEDVMAKVEEELGELKQAISNNDQENMKEELGDLLFSIVNLSRFLNVNSTDALEKTIKKFDTRFRYVEKNCDLTTSSLDTMEKFWNEAKNKH
ncbi:nucleoside triphosphate pyrophosphohydrolase [Fusobacterium ulcerans]|uniref:nucleoside triphosphate pyrophosphohydrolase n=1 Tax=Fusobacterium ulcerans TaxID=861 RepID=UPI000E54F441|nr:nucleoside triphosphate pyrophosphohydrolase [Fusobacterium ulcerans]RGY64368.1 nucleoside triphosphate pyrophosphohydrolase [Fusobacterium ulcerans]